MKLLRVALMIVTAMTFTIPTLANAAPQFLSYEGRNAVREGEGGEKRTVNGVDFWMDGSPPRRFKILGSLKDRRHKTGLLGMVRMAGLDDDIAKAALAVGANAVILISEGDEVVGHIANVDTTINGYQSGNSFNGSANTFGYGSDIKKRNSKYIVIQYLSDAASTPE